VGELSHRAVIRIAPFASSLELTVAKFVRFAEPALLRECQVQHSRAPPMCLAKLPACRLVPANCRKAKNAMECSWKEIARLERHTTSPDGICLARGVR
jgi:hypothetical protein